MPSGCVRLLTGEKGSFGRRVGLGRRAWLLGPGAVAARPALSRPRKEGAARVQLEDARVG